MIEVGQVDAGAEDASAGIFRVGCRCPAEHADPSGIVEEHQGSIGLASVPGEGATFTVWLPSIPAPAEPVSPLPAPERQAGSEAGPIGERVPVSTEARPA